MRCLLLLLIPGLLFTEGCSFLTHPGKAPSQSSAAAQTATPAEKPAPKAHKKGFLENLLHPFAGSNRNTPPKAQPLRQVGTVRTLSNDGSYVIVELEPGTMVAAGGELLITATGGKPARLKVAEIQGTYFVADIVEGNPEAGDRVQQ